MVMLVLHAKFEVLLVKFATNVTWGQFSGIFDINKSQYVEKLSKLRTIFACLLDFSWEGMKKSWNHLYVVLTWRCSRTRPSGLAWHPPKMPDGLFTYLKSTELFCGDNSWPLYASMPSLNHFRQWLQVLSRADTFGHFRPKMKNFAKLKTILHACLHWSWHV